MPLNIDAEHLIEKTKLHYVDILGVTYVIMGKNYKTETSFNAPMYLMLLRYNDIICICCIFKTSRLHLMLYYLKMIFLYL